MSRHIRKHHSKPKHVLIYGFDRPLQQYFWQEWKRGQAAPIAESPVTGSSRGDLLDKMVEYGIVAGTHMEALALNRPIPDEPHSDPVYTAYTYDVTTQLEDRLKITRGEAADLVAARSRELERLYRDKTPTTEAADVLEQMEAEHRIDEAEFRHDIEAEAYES